MGLAESGVFPATLILLSQLGFCMNLGARRLGKSPKKGLDFLIHLVGVRQSAGDFVMEQLAVAFAQAVNRHAQGAFLHAQRGGHFALGAFCRARGEESF